jgi:hypothetical protein
LNPLLLCRCRSALHNCPSEVGPTTLALTVILMTGARGWSVPLRATHLPCSSGRAAAALVQPLNGVSNAQGERTRPPSTARRIPVKYVAPVGVVAWCRCTARGPGVST